MAKPGLDDEIHLVEQIGRQAFALDGRGMKGGIDAGALDSLFAGLTRQAGTFVGQQAMQGLVVAVVDDGVGEIAPLGFPAGEMIGGDLQQ